VLVNWFSGGVDLQYWARSPRPTKLVQVMRAIVKHQLLSARRQMHPDNVHFFSPALSMKNGW
jgi:hypothetical protein